ncbi:MAG: DUF1501 domain-containing protein [Rubrivivax sp.]|nr:MAG: DUF1501 domain-containing protein [Rubrivivax sp.]
MNHSNRRQFLKRASMLGAAGITTPWALNLASMGVAAAQSSSATDYKALVCIFMAGGNDAHNTVLATDGNSRWNYLSARDPNAAANFEADQAGDPLIASPMSIALPMKDLRPITIKQTDPWNRTFALNPELRRIQQMYADGKAAVIANVGPLVMPTLKVNINLTDQLLPKNLMSHNDQTSTWQTFSPEGAVGGWGGLMMDSLMSRNTSATFSSIAINSGSTWLAGNQVSPYQLSTSGLYRMAGEGTTFGSTAVFEAVRRIAATPSRQDTLALDYTKTVQRALSVEGTLLTALPAADRAPWGSPGAASAASDPLLKYTNPNTQVSSLNPLAVQLQLVARMISARNATAIGAKRQVFMISMGGFDTHSDQNATHADLMAKLDQAIGYFYDTLAQMPGGQDMRSNVTTFTASEFGRTLNNNGDGTDHGWGGHHFVFGGSVKGGDMYGTFPLFTSLDTDTGVYQSADFLSNGILLPSQSVDQFAYTLGKWMDVSESALVGVGGAPGIVPNIRNFDVDTRNLGFMA